MSALADTEGQLVDWVASCVYDPLKFVVGAFPWGESGPLKKSTGPDTWQEDVLKEIGENSGTLEEALQIAVASGHGIGKSALVAWIILWFISTRPHPQIVVTANTAPQLTNKTWRELAKWHKLLINTHWFAWTATKFYHRDHPETWFAAAIPWSRERSEAFAGTHEEHVLVIFDEASAIDDIIWEVSEGAMTTPGAMWVAFGNPTRNTGRFKECFGRLRHRWITHQIDSRTAKMANRTQIATWVEDYGEDSDFVRVRVRGLFPRAGSAQLISSEVVEAARKRVVEGFERAPKLMGVDVARHGDDQSVILIRQGKKLHGPILRLRIPDTMDLASRVASEIAIHRPDAVFVDASGMGWAVVDRLRQLNHTVIAVQVGEAAKEPEKYYNRRAEVWCGMRDWLAEGADIPDDQELADDLIGPEYGFDNRMRTQLEKKEDMKKRGLASPDSADALSVTFDQMIAAPKPAVRRPPPNWRAA